MAVDTGIRRLWRLHRKLFGGANRVPADLIGDAVQHSKHAVLAAQNIDHGFGGVHLKWLQLAEQEQSENVIEIGTGEDYANDRRVARPRSWMEFR